jgi:hypothetical protein
MSNLKFEDCIESIDKELNKRKHSWRLQSVNHLDYEDIKQEIRLHLWQKWHLYDQKKPLVNWVNKIISHQIINKIRDNYGIYAKPCNNNVGKKCAYNEGNDLCGFTPSGKQCSECILYSKWEKSKKNAYEMNLAKNIEDHYFEIDIGVDGNKDIDYNEFLFKIKDRIKEMVPSFTYKVYLKILVEGKSASEAAKELGYKTNEKNRDPGYKQILNHFTIIKNAVKELLEEEDYRFLE